MTAGRREASWTAVNFLAVASVFVAVEVPD